MTKLSPEERFWSKVDRRSPDDCWLWLGQVMSGGYGRGTYRGRRSNAHRIAFEIANGHEPYPFALHKCDVKLCCNPEHLYEGDHKQNMRDMAQRGRAFRNLTKRTHCLRGHHFTPDNTILRGDVRLCLECSRIREARKYARRLQQKEAA